MITAPSSFGPQVDPIKPLIIKTNLGTPSSHIITSKGIVIIFKLNSIVVMKSRFLTVLIQVK